MKKAIVIILTIVILCAGIGAYGWFSGWFCSHEWVAADCTNPQTCSKCGNTEGMPEGHIWLAATCLEPRTCEVCGTTKDEPKGHDWQEAACETPKQCARCYLRDGDPLGHSWLEATTEAAKTCQTCGATEGERIVTDPRFTTAANQDLLGKWGCELVLDGEAMGISGMENSPSFIYTLNFGPAGDLGIGFEVADEEAFLNALIRISVEAEYKNYEAQGYSKEDIDKAFQENYGMSAEEYVRASLAGLSINEILRNIYQSMSIGGVYYVQDGQLYQGLSWEGEMTASAFTVDGDNLTIASFNEAFGFEAVFVRIPE